MKIEKVLNRMNEEELFGIANDLIRIPSHSDTPGEEKEISGFVEDLVRRWGFDVTPQEVEDNRSNVIVKVGGRGGGRSLALNGHLDTVPPAQDMKDPYRPVIRNGCLYGRGACDMKGAVAAMLYALYLLEKGDVRLEGDLYFTGVVGEEMGGIGTRFLTDHGFRPDFAVVGEPTSLNLVTSHKGAVQLEVRIRGRAAHASMPEQGVNAISAVSEFIQRLEKELVPELRKRSQERVGTATLSLGLIQGGEKVNIVADFCRLQIDRRWVRTESADQVVSEIRSILERVCERDPALHGEIVSLHPRGYFGPFAIPEDHELVRRAKQALKLAGRSPRISGMQGWTDAATFMHAGIPAVLLGPGSVAQAHTSDEYVNLGQLVDAAKFYVALTKTVCGWV